MEPSLDQQLAFQLEIFLSHTKSEKKIDDYLFSIFLETGDIFPGVKTIAEKAGVSIRTVQYYIKKLKDLNGAFIKAVPDKRWNESDTSYNFVFSKPALKVLWWLRKIGKKFATKKDHKKLREGLKKLEARKELTLPIPKKLKPPIKSSQNLHQPPPQNLHPYNEDLSFNRDLRTREGSKIVPLNPLFEDLEIDIYAKGFLSKLAERIGVESKEQLLYALRSGKDIKNKSAYITQVAKNLKSKYAA